MNQEYAFNVIKDIYDEGDRDYIFMENIIGLIAYDEFDDPRGMSDDEVFIDAMKVICFLTKFGDFEMFRASNKKGVEEISHELCEGDAFKIESLLRDEARKTGKSNFFDYQFVLKKTKKGKIPPEIPQEISELWG